MTELPPIIRFAEQHYVFGPEAAISGPFRADNSPYLIEIAAALSNPLKRHVNAQIGAQGGKNALIELFIAYTILNRPGNILFYGQTDDTAEAFAEDRVLKRVKQMKCMQHVWPDSQHSGAHRIKEAKLAHMGIEFLGANASNTQGKSARFVVRDEAHLWVGVKAGMMEQAANRADAFWDAMIFTTSTGPDQNTDQDTEFNSGTMKIWNIGCPDCGRRVRGRFVQPKWTEKPRFLTWEGDEHLTKPEGKAWNIQEVRRRVRFKCPHEDCGAEHRDNFDLRLEMNRNGSYVQTNMSAAGNNESFRVSQLAFPWVAWEEIAEKWIKSSERAKLGDMSLRRNFIVKILAETWKTEITGGSAQLVTGAYSTKDVFRWEKEKQRYGLFDVQESGGMHFPYSIYAFSEDSESRLIHAGRANSWAEVEEIRQRYTIIPGRIGIDSNYRGKEVREVCAARGYTWLEAQENTRQFLHTIGKEKIYRCYSPQVRVDTGIGRARSLIPNPTSRIAYGYRYSKQWAMEAVHYRVAGLGARFEVPEDVADLRWRGTIYEQTSYMEQISSWVPMQVTDEKTNETKRTWRQSYKEDHIRSVFEEALILASIDGLVPSDVSE